MEQSEGRKNVLRPFGDPPRVPRTIADVARQKRGGARHAYLLLLVLLGGLIVVDCGGCGNDPDIKETGTIGKKSGKTEVRCNCQIAIAQVCRIAVDPKCSVSCDVPDVVTVPMDLCLPSNLNADLGDPAFDALTDDQWQTNVRDYCENTTRENVRRWFGFLSPKGAGCGTPAVNCDTDIKCELQAFPNGESTLANDKCSVPCDNVACTSQNCDNDKVAPKDDPNIHPELCKCTVAGRDCTGRGNTDIMCRTPPGNSDPPALRSGLLTWALSAPNSIELDETQSALNIDVHFDDFIGTTHERHESAKIAGTVELFGHPCPGRECDVLFDFAVSSTDLAFSFTDVVCGPFCLEDVNVSVERVGLAGGTGPIPVHILADGTGHIPPHALSFRAETIVMATGQDAPVRKIIDKTNDSAIDFTVDFAAKTFSLPDAPFNFENGGGTLRLIGNIVNRPPAADAGPDQILECTAPSGARATLDGTASQDLDGDVVLWEWWKGTALTDGNDIGRGRTIDVLAPFQPPSLTTDYRLSISDSRLATSVARTSITVRDTTAPTITASAIPDCLWAPAHKMVLFTLGNTIAAKAEDACDGAPTLKIAGASSSQPALGGGSGNTAPDVIAG